MTKTLLIVALSFGLTQAAYAARCNLDARTGCIELLYFIGMTQERLAE